MQIQARIAALALALAAFATPAAAKGPCEKSLATSDTFNKALEAVLAVPGVEKYEFKPIGRPPQPPEFLDLAQKVGFEGTVIVMLVVAPDGQIADRVITCSEPFGYFEPEVLDWAKGYKFAPLQAGMPEHYRIYTITAAFKFSDSDTASRIRR